MHLRRTLPASLAHRFVVCLTAVCLTASLVILPSPAHAKDPLNRTSPLYTEYNAFLRAENWLELIAVGTADANVRVTLYNSDGTVKQAFTDIITAGRQTDIDIRAKVLGDTYGLVEVELLNSANGGVQLQGRMAIYRTRVETGNVLTYDFAYALPLRDTVVGKTFSFSNSVDPQGLNNPVYNWVSIVNLAPTTETYSYRRYNQAGTLIRNGTFSLMPNQKCDLEGGHEDGQGVFLNEITPFNAGVPYISTSMRYAVDSANIQTGAVLRYAFAMPTFSEAPIDSRFLPASNRENRTGTGARYDQSNWIELANTSNGPATANLTVRNQNGTTFDSPALALPAHSQFHYNVSLPLNGQGSDLGLVIVDSNPPNTVLAQSVVYHHSVRSNKLTTAYNFQPLAPTTEELFGSYNLNLKMVNELVLYGTNSGGKTPLVEVFRSGAETGEASLSVPSFGSTLISLADTRFRTIANTLGPIKVTNTSNNIGGYVIRSRTSNQANALNELEFAFPTLVR